MTKILCLTALVLTTLMIACGDKTPPEDPSKAATPPTTPSTDADASVK